MDYEQLNYISNAKQSCFIDKSVRLGKNVIIYPNNTILGECVIGDNVVLYPNNFIIDSEICKNAIITSSVIEGSLVGESAKIGPFSHLRPGAKIGKNSKIGNFVEVKNSNIGNGSKINHLSYVGDAEIGENVNIGCGVVFVNYNGKTKSKSKIGDGAFIGSSVNVIAPVNIGKRAFVCAGTTIDKDIEAGSFAIGRSRVQIRPGKAEKYFK